MTLCERPASSLAAAKAPSLGIDPRTLRVRRCPRRAAWRLRPKSSPANSSREPWERIDHAGRNFPLGATVFADGVNFSVFSRHASRVEPLLFDDGASAYPTRVIDLDARRHRAYHYWHTFVPG